MAYVRGHVEHVIHQAADSTYFVFALAPYDSDFPAKDKKVTVSGHLCGLPRLRTGIPIHIVGEWIKHPKYGRQFQPAGWYPWSRSVYDTIRFLHECIEGFGDYALVREVVDKFQDDTFEAMNDPARVHAAFPEGDARHAQLELALLQWKTARALSDLSIFLQDYQLGPETVKGIYDTFGHDAIGIISKNPYRLIAVDGFHFAQADRIATKLGIPRDDPRRVEGAVLWILRAEARQGHLFVRRGELPQLLNALVQQEMTDPFDIPDIYGALQEAVGRLEEATAVRVDPEAGVYLAEYYFYERRSAVKLAEFLSSSILQVDLDQFLSEYESSNQMELSEAQHDAVHILVKNRALVLTGLPGTGKTTVIRTFVRLFKRAGISFALMAPTGIAAKRLSAVTGEDAMTIHRTFGCNGFDWEFGQGNKFSIGAAIVDEMSMVDQELFYRVVDALHPSTMLILVGDDAQLPSVGPGNVLRELISCPSTPHVRLTQIYRQTHTSEIVIASHKINRGDSPLPEVRNPESEFQFVQMSDEDKIVEFIVAAAAKLKGRDANFQILSPKHEGTVGVTNLNEKLRDRLNPNKGQKEWRAGPLFVREGDRLMVVKNNYSLNIYNGDMGKLMSIEKDYLAVRIHGIGASSPDTYVNIPKDNAVALLKLAYAITVHKSQGSEFDTVIMPIVKAQGRMLQRNLFYTAVTRARKKVWLLGDSSAVFRAIGNDKVVSRNTLFGRAVTAAREELARGVGGAHERDNRDRKEAVRTPDN